MTELIVINGNRKLENIRNLSKYCKNIKDSEKIKDNIKIIEENLNQKLLDIY